MSLKSQLLRELECHRDTDLSGQYLAEKYGVSRNAIWKAIQQLRQEGYRIESTPNRGYCLTADNDLLSAEGIGVHLPARYRELPVYLYREIDSTNNQAKRLIAEGLHRTALVVAETQTAGRGRRGRSFYSPEKTGIYMTMVIHPQMELHNAVTITTAASVAVVRALKSLCGVFPQIKWVNDIYLNGKKMGGILTEAVTDLESGTIQSILIGIGLNVRTTRFPKEIADIAVSLHSEGTGKCVNRNRLIAVIASHLLDMVAEMGDTSYMEEYRSHSLVLGRTITYTQNGQTYEAQAVDIDDTGGLVVSHPNGETVVLRSGDITVRLQDG